MAYDASERAVLREARAIRQRKLRAAKKARPKSPKADRGRVRDNAYLAHVRRLPCCVGPEGCSGPVEAAHVRYSAPGEPMTGMQRKPSDSRAVPLCAAHHRTGPDAQHARGERQWWAARGIDPLALSARLYVEFLKGSPRGSEAEGDEDEASQPSGMPKNPSPPKAPYD